MKFCTHFVEKKIITLFTSIIITCSKTLKINKFIETVKLKETKFTESASSDQNYGSSKEMPVNKEEDNEEIDDENVPKKSDFDLLKESPPVNTIRPNAVDMMVTAEEPTTICENLEPAKEQETTFKVGDLIWGVTRGCDAWPGKIVNGSENEATSSSCVWVKWFGGRQNVEMVQCSTLKSLSEGLEAHHAARKETRT